MAKNPASKRIRLKDLCARLGVDYDESRYALTRGILPKGVEAEPGKGNHRWFDPSQAFYLAVALKLKAAGLPTPLAANLSKWSRHIQGYAANFSWDPGFAPFMGQFQTTRQWFLDVGDGRYVRLATDARPSHMGLFETRWVELDSRKECRDAKPTIMVRIDIAAIAKLLSDPVSDASMAGHGQAGLSAPAKTAQKTFMRRS